MAVCGRRSGPRLREQLRRAFEKDGAFIRSQEESPMLATHPQSVTHFRDDDRGFFGWLEHNPDGYFINSERNPNRPTWWRPESGVNRRAWFRLHGQVRRWP